MHISIANERHCRARVQTGMTISVSQMYVDLGNAAIQDVTAFASVSSSAAIKRRTKPGSRLASGLGFSPNVEVPPSI